MLIEPHIKALIFDCDGTLADTMPLHYEAWQETMAALGGHFPEQLFYDTAGMHNKAIARVLNQQYGYTFDPQTTAGAKEARFAQKIAHIRPIERVVAITKTYRGRLPMAVGSGGELPMVRQILAVIGLTDCFDAIVTSEQVPNGKPAPDIFLEAARRMKVEPQFCQVFEDGNSGLEAARRAGMAATDIRLWRE
jgi:beta-phosphoglucomutase-like phosphatase (HAD superfamily)